MRTPESCYLRCRVGYKIKRAGCKHSKSRTGNPKASGLSSPSINMANFRNNGYVSLIQLLIPTIISITTMHLIPVGAVTIVRHALTPNCQDPRQFCENLQPYTCCSFPDIGARSLEFAQVLAGNVMMGFAPDISGRDMCKYLVKHSVGDGGGQRYCMPNGDYTGGMWRPAMPPRTDKWSEVGPYPWSKCKYYVNATDIDPNTYETEVLANLL